MVHCEICEAEFPGELIVLYNDHPVCERCESDLKEERVYLESRLEELENTILLLVLSDNSLELHGMLVNSLQNEILEIAEELKDIHGVDC